MKRIGIYLSFPPEGGGAFQYAHSLLTAALALPPSEFEIVVVHAHPAWKAKLEEMSNRARFYARKEGLVEQAVRLVLRLGAPLGAWRACAPFFHPLTRFLLRLKCNLWVFPSQDFLTYALPAPTVGVIHDLMHIHERQFAEVSGWGLYKRRERHYQSLCIYSSAILVDSKLGKKHVCDAYEVQPNKVHVLPYIAPPHSQVPGQQTDFNDRYALPESFIFYPAQFWQHKNHVRLLRALSLAHKTVPDLHLVLVGAKKNAYKEILKTIQDLDLDNHVHIYGYIPDSDVPAFYKRARALVMPTFFGPTNIPPLEAMAAGCPMAVSNVYAMADQVGEAALLFDPTSETSIANAIIRLASDDALCKQLSEAGREISSNWGAEQFNGRFHDIIRCILAPE